MELAMAKAIMIQGTMSNAGKSIICAALCRIFSQDGYRVAPFKSQNMALNSYVTCDGLEMGRAQAVQAQAAGRVPSADMNPILLKPTSDVGSQVILNGRPIGDMTAREYYGKKRQLVPDIMAAYERLSGDNDIIVVEGAGSPAEINLKSDDIVNMGLAAMLDAPVLLVGDIDRGGVFAQLYGTVALLEDNEKKRIKGTIINKFRGDAAILGNGLDVLENLTNVPCLGVVPYLDVDIEDEDSLGNGLVGRSACGAAVKDVDIAVIRLPRISNHTDFDCFGRFPGVSLRFVSGVGELGSPDCIVLPGTKSTGSDLLWMRANGIEAAVKKHGNAGKPLIGICGGMQMLGVRLVDQVGGRTRQLEGMGLLDLDTRMAADKTLRQVSGSVSGLVGDYAAFNNHAFDGYEIHMGESRHAGKDIAPGAIVQEGNVLGTYVHGIFDSGFDEALVRLLYGKKGLHYVSDGEFDREAHKQRQFDLLADGVRGALDMERIYWIVGG
jgi:adenosylcobyric acid synthase